MRAAPTVALSAALSLLALGCGNDPADEPIDSGMGADGGTDGGGRPDTGPVGAKAAVAPTLDRSSMVDFPAGSFDMGWPDQAIGNYGDAWFVNQQPQHSVNLGAFSLDTHEVTVADFALFLSYAGGAAHFHPDQPIEQVADGYLPVAGSAAEPIRQVSWQAAADYCAWAGKRLPTEAEWEFAAAGSAGRTYPWDPERGGASCQRAVYFTASSFCEPQPVAVGSRAEGASPEGVMDLAGNVAEWTADWYGSYTAGSVTDPRGPDSGLHRAVRGGGYLDAPLALRNQYRRGVLPSSRSENLGFRCAWSEDLVPDGALRGELQAPADVERVASGRPYAPVATQVDVLAEGLMTPTALARIGNEWFIAERGNGRVVAVADGAPGVLRTALELDQPSWLATDGSTLFVTDDSAGAILALDAPGDPASAVTISAEENKPTLIVADATDLFWLDEATIRRHRRGSGTTEDFVTGLDSVGGMALSESHLYFVDRGNSTAAKTQLARVDRNSGAVEKLFGQDVLGSAFTLGDVARDPRGGGSFVTLYSRGWPNSGFVCRFADAGGALSCSDYSPPRASHLAVSSTAVYWTTNYTVASDALGTRAPFTLPGTWSRGGDIGVDQGKVVWTNRQNGRVYAFTE